MPRPLRVEYSGAWYHVMNRGACHKNIFHSTTHRQIFLEMLAQAHDSLRAEIHAYCLMSNHYHLLLRTPEANLSKIMRHINGVYTQKYNKTMQKDGALFRGRYRAKLIGEDSYLQQVSRYIHLNPVEANIITDPRDYEWSSYFYFIGNIKPPPWLYTKFTLSLFGNQDEKKLYKQYVDRGDASATREFFNAPNSSSIYGSDEYRNKITSEFKDVQINACKTDFQRTIVKPNLETICLQCALQLGVDVVNIMESKRGKLNINRKIAMYCCSYLTNKTYPEIAAYFNCSAPNIIGNAIAEVSGLRRSNKDIDSTIKLILNVYSYQTLLC